MKNNKKIIFLLLSVAAIIIIAVAGYGFFSNQKPGDKPKVENRGAEARKAETPAVDLKPADSAAIPADILYRHINPDFSLKHPADLKVSASAGGGGETIVFQKAGQRKGFQIFISPYVETANLRDVVAAAFPNLKVESPQEVIIGSNVHALLFWSSDPAIGQTRELWFVYGKFLFQATARAEFDSLLGEVFMSFDK